MKQRHQFNRLCALAVLLLPAIVSAAPRAYVTNWSYSFPEVHVLDTATNAVIATVQIFDNDPYGVAVDPTGTRVYVTSDNALSVIDTATNLVTATVALKGGRSAITISPDGDRLYAAADNSQSIAVVDATTNTIVSSIDVTGGVGAYVVDLATNPAGTLVYALLHGAQASAIQVLDTTTNAIVATVHLYQGAGVNGIAASPDGTKIYVTIDLGIDGDVLVLDAASYDVTAAIPVGLSPLGIAVNRTGTRAYVSNVRSGDVSVIDTATNAVIATVPVGAAPSGIAVNPAGTRVYAANYQDGTVAVIDASTNAVMKTVGVGNAPVAWGRFIAQTAPARPDLDGDGNGDIVWRNVATGDLNVWLMNGLALTPASGNAGNAPAADWKILGVGDFDGDGKSDLLWQNTATGDVNVWFMDGTAIKPASGNVAAVNSAVWQFAGVGDVNGDGTSDIVWRNTTTGDVYVWLMRGLAMLPGSGPVANAPLVWSIIGTGDFDGDGKSDLLWRNGSTGDVNVWLLDGTAVKPGSGNIASLAPGQWQFGGAGDVDGDGKADIVWRNLASGDVHVWLMNGRTLRAGSGFVNTAPPAIWTIVGMGDFDGDGKADLLWRSASQDVNAWLMDGTSIKPTSGTIANVGSAQWQSVKP